MERLYIRMRNKNLSDDERDIIIFGDLRTTDEKLGRVRDENKNVRYL